ncbi:hypothetical protein YC2023_002400 [Brassica napus]
MAELREIVERAGRDRHNLLLTELKETGTTKKSDAETYDSEMKEVKTTTVAWDGSDNRVILRYPDPDPYPADP